MPTEWRIERFCNDFSSLSKHEAPTRDLGPGDIRVEMKCAALNYRDLLMIRGVYNPNQALPLVPLSDGAGIVAEVGSDVDSFSIGDAVCSLFLPECRGNFGRQQLRQTPGGPLPGMLTKEIVAPAHHFMRAAKNLSMAENATLVVAGLTAWNALQSGAIDPSKTVLVQGTGGVSIFAAQVAKAYGARVIATSSKEAKRQRLRELGADFVFDYTTDDWVAETRKIGGADIVVEVGGAKTISDSIKCLRAGGTIASVGVLSGGKAELSLTRLMMDAIKVVGILVGTPAQFLAFRHFVEEEKIRPTLDRSFSFQNAKDAFQYLESGNHFGKVTIDI